ncbi:MAG: type II secretion system protein [Planctomycetota bacterium]|nr:type II secretion system protein [Planctomycetota bacterium]
MSAFRGARTSGRGFTLVELMVVIAIIGALVALLVGAIGPAIRMAQNLQCQNNLKQIATAVINYATDYRGAIPPTKYTGPSGLYWCNILVRGNYLTADDTSRLDANTSSPNNVLKCPAASDSIISSTQSVDNPGSDLAQGTARLGNSAFMVDCSYYWNGYDGNATGRPDTTSAGWTFRFPSVLVDPAATPDVKAQVIHDISEIRQRSVTAMVMDGILFNANATSNRGRIAARHSGDIGERCRTNIAFYDGHVGRAGRQPGEDKMYRKDQIQTAKDLDGAFGGTTVDGESDPVIFLLPLR